VLPSRLLSFALLLTALAVSAAPRKFSGEIDGALYQIVAPEGDWNGSLWIEAHGHRSEESPLLAQLSEANSFNAALLGRGWAIATTSYRRNGIIIDDAITDLIALRAEAASRLGEPRIVILEGSSMGGGIVTLIAESQDAGKFTGVVAAGAAMQVVDPPFTSLTLKHVPRIPIVFLTNQSELDGPAAYVAAVRATTSHDAVQPLLWKVLRDGHVNVNSPERIAALDAVVVWAATGVSPGDRDDATIAMDAGPSTASVADDGSLDVTVLDLSRGHGNFYTNLRPADLERLGVARGGSFKLTAPGGAFTVFYGTTYSDVPQGEWIAFPTADGTVMIARNRANAAETARLAIGDTFTVARAQ
jgi:pimeloyl-ACP methyl ester carboxylesterase